MSKSKHKTKQPNIASAAVRAVSLIVPSAMSMFHSAYILDDE